jgi:transglutaminase-like putative cysteine protease
MEIQMDRRSFIQAGTALSATSLLPAFAETAAQRVFTPQSGDWRSFEIVHRIELLKPNGDTKVWLPVAVVQDGYQRALDTTWTVSSGDAKRHADPRYGAAMLAVNFDQADAKPVVEMTTRVQTQSRAIDWAQRSTAALSAEEISKWTAATALMPTDGIVKTTAMEVTKDAKTDVEKVRALYDWTISNTYRKVETRGCGVGDVKLALESPGFGGKCADINAIFVALCRASGLPARDIYGIRLVKSAFGYKELGAGSATITKSQHCRAEVFLTGYGWVAMDPADVGKVQRVETPEWIKTVDHPIVAPVYKALFGGWEGNWLAYNTGHDIVLPGAKGPKLGFLMYPHAETAEGRLDSYDPDNFKYTITAKEIVATATATVNKDS